MAAVITDTDGNIDGQTSLLFSGFKIGRAVNLLVYLTTVYVAGLTRRP